MSTASDIFEANGSIALALPKYERRDAQVQMASAVEDVVTRSGILLAEAGTGTGKTLAYLVPAILSEHTVVISTGTKNLQEQVFFKDIDFLQSALNRSAQAVYLKGQDNYLCLRRLSEFFRSHKSLAHPVDRVSELETWAKSTQSGDRMEVEGLPDNDPLWHEVCSTRETRIGAKCRFHAECFVTRARQRAMQANLIVVNHHLYFADLSVRLKGGSILPSHDIVIFDEAHDIENVATEFFSTTVSERRVDRAIGDAQSTIKAAGLSDDPSEQGRPNLFNRAREASSELFYSFRGPEGRAILIPEEISGSKLEAYHRLDTALDALENSMRVVEGRDETIDHSTDRISDLRKDFADVLAQTAKGFVHWVEGRKRSVVLGASPIDVSQILRERIFFAIPTVVLTSATLSTARFGKEPINSEAPCPGQNFDFIKKRLGLDFDVNEISVPSVFDYEKQACVYLPTHLPDPRDPSFLEQAALEAEKLIDLTSGGALFLFTSLRNMRAIHGLLEGRVPGRLLLQGEAPKSILISRFFESPASTLCASASFWQGVDIPGDALRLVIIDKLPFASPGDPLTAARISHLKENGHNPFTEYQVPLAALSLKQGFGRLIRTRDDRGIVAILDDRLHTMPYSKAFLSSLPPCPRLGDFNAVNTWWQRSTPA